MLQKHFPDVPKWRDICELTGKDIIRRIGWPTLISAGFPCQPHSTAGKRLASGDERDLTGELKRIIRQVKPRWFLAENVPGLRSSESGRFFGKFLYDLSEMGYTVGWGSWRASDVGAWHKRERIFIVAYSNSCGFKEQRNPITIEPGYCKSKHGCKSDILNSESIRYGESGIETDEWNRSPSPVAGGGSYVSNTGGRGQQRSGESFNAIDSTQNKIGKATWAINGGGSNLWKFEPQVGRVAHGIPARLDRIRALGNAVVPQQVYPILKAISDIERSEINGT